MKKIITIKKILWIVTALWGAAFPLKLSAATLQGKVVNHDGNAPDLAIISLAGPQNAKAYSNEDGSFQINCQDGEYTLTIVATSYQTLSQKINLQGNVTMNFTLQRSNVSAQKITIYNDREVQKVSRYTMTSAEIKKTPAALGDALRALKALPGITSRGFFGSLIFRGAESRLNRYYIDDIPVMNPTHFGGFHTVVSSDLISEIDVFSSAFPARYGDSIAALISMNTLDDVKGFGAIGDIGVISANAMVYGQINPDAEGQNNKGYYIVSGRLGYISALFPLFNLLLKLPIDQLPEYYDYQVKAKYFFTRNFSMRLLAFGSYDTFAFNDSPQAQEARASNQQGGDPLSNGIEAKFDLMNHSQGIYFDYFVPNSYSLNLLLFSSLNTRYSFINLPESALIKNVVNDSKPYVFGVKSKQKFPWLNEQSYALLGLEALYYHYVASGKELVALAPIIGQPNFNDPTQFEMVEFKNRADNVRLGAYFENKFQWSQFTFTPGIRSDYLNLSKETTLDPRAMLGYEFIAYHNIALSAGIYSSFVQLDPTLFNNDQQVAVSGDYRFEKARHIALGYEGRFEQYLLKIESFYNYFHDITYGYNDPNNLAADGRRLTRINSGEGKNYGFEILLRRDLVAETNGYYYWLNYTYTQAKTKAGIPNNEYTHVFINSSNEEVHAVKFTGGYKLNRHDFGLKISFLTSFPYTNIVGDDGDPQNIGRYAPLSNSIRNTNRYEPSVQLDFRYTWQTKFSWGNLNAYVEIINFTALLYTPKTQQRWRYDMPFSETNPVIQEPQNALPFIPNFGLEFKF